ncbi:hypothetical protein Ciccas_006199 [Cichlidogyrus casuarinus]|uniref:Uncharacterized protein n=1 Tax=Cichlidogyrus casuarinus TaxID=1844966 RepID=A0ABD2Q6S6_9PLAT
MQIQQVSRHSCDTVRTFVLQEVPDIAAQNALQIDIQLHELFRDYLLGRRLRAPLDFIRSGIVTTDTGSQNMLSRTEAINGIYVGEHIFNLMDEFWLPIFKLKNGELMQTEIVVGIAETKCDKTLSLFYQNIISPAHEMRSQLLCHLQQGAPRDIFMQYLALFLKDDLFRYDDEGEYSIPFLDSINTLDPLASYASHILSTHKPLDQSMYQQT